MKKIRKIEFDWPIELSADNARIFVDYNNGQATGLLPVSYGIYPSKSRDGAETVIQHLINRANTSLNENYVVNYSPVLGRAVYNGSNSNGPLKFDFAHPDSTMSPMLMGWPEYITDFTIPAGSTTSRGTIGGVYELGNKQFNTASQYQSNTNGYGIRDFRIWPEQNISKSHGSPNSSIYMSDDRLIADLSFYNMPAALVYKYATFKEQAVTDYYVNNNFRENTNNTLQKMWEESVKWDNWPERGLTIEMFFEDGNSYVSPCVWYNETHMSDFQSMITDSPAGERYDINLQFACMDGESS